MTHLWENRSKDLDLLRLGRDFMLPIQMHASLANQRHEVQLRVHLTKAVVRPSTEHEPVLDLLLRVTGDPSVWVEAVWVRVSFWVVQRWVGRWDHHRALRSGVGGRDGEVALGDVGHHDYGGPVA